MAKSMPKKKTQASAKQVKSVKETPKKSVAAQPKTTQPATSVPVQAQGAKVPVNPPAVDRKVAEKTWNDFASRMGDQMTQSLKERADYQKEMYAKWVQVLKNQGIGSDEKIAHAVQEYQKLYSQWNEFAENTGKKVRDTLVSSWDGQKEKMGNLMDMAGKMGAGTGVDYKGMVEKSMGDLRAITGQILPKELGQKVEFPKETFENWLRAYTEAWEVVLKSPAFVSFLGVMLDSTLDMKKKQEDQAADIIRSIGLPSRKDMDAVYKRLHELTQKVNEQSRVIKKLEKGN